MQNPIANCRGDVKNDNLGREFHMESALTTGWCLAVKEKGHWVCFFCRRHLSS